MTSVLIIDDHPIVLQGCRRMLEDAGVAARARSARPDLGLSPLPPPPSRRRDRRSRHAGQRPRRPRRDPPHPLARSAHADPGVQHAQRPDHRGARARSRRHRLCAQGHLVGRADEGVRAGARPARPISATISPCRWRWCAPACGQIRSPTSRRANCRRCRLLAEGKPYGRIAEELNVSYKTVVNTCSQLKQKLNAKNLPELIRLAVQLVAAEAITLRSFSGRLMHCSNWVARAADARPRCVPNATLPDVPITNGKT